MRRLNSRAESIARPLVELTPEQQALRELAPEFAEREIRPRAAEYDEQRLVIAREIFLP